MLKITEINRTKSTVILKLEGKVTEELIEAVKAACEPVLLGGYRLLLDMADISFVERRAVLFFRELQTRQVALINCSLFLSEQLKKGGDNYVISGN